MECRFCKIARDREIISETTHTFAFLSDPRLMIGHMLVIPKRHVEKLSELTKEEREDFFDHTIRLQEKILSSFASGCDICQHYRPFIPDNKFKVSHLHIHLRPRELDDELYRKVQIHEREVFQDVKEEE